MGYPDVAWGINELRDTFYGGVQEFLNTGSFTVPDNVYKIYVTACAAGASGGELSDFTNPMCGGNAGEFIVRKPFMVNPGQVIPITIGIGGVATGDYESYKSSPGGNTVIGSLITLKGGTNTIANNGGCRGGIPFNYAQEIGKNIIKVGASVVSNGMNSSMASGGRAGTSCTYIGDNYYANHAPGGCGGGASLGHGGDGGDSVSGNGSPERKPTNGGLGAGGGGCGSYAGKYDSSTDPLTKPGNGGKGYCLIEW